MSHVDRRQFLQTVSSLAAGAATVSLLSEPAYGQQPAGAPEAAGETPFLFGLVTYQWGKDWDLPTLIKNCETAGARGVELRTTHAHAVEPTLNNEQREAVRQRFANSDVELVGIGSNERFDNPDPAVVRKAIEASKEFIRLSHDVGGTGVKVKPDRFHPSVPREKTIEQIGRSLAELGEYGAGYGQEIRLEVHGQCAELPTIKAIIDVADHENVRVCWNSNAQDLQGEGLEYNFNLVRPHFGSTLHVRELDTDQYPMDKLFELLVKSNYGGWMLLEASSEPEDGVAALTKQAKLFHEMLAAAQGNR